MPQKDSNAVNLDEHDPSFNAKRVEVFTGLNSGALGILKPQGFNIGDYDYVALTQTSTTDVYTFKIGGAGGTLISTITITYTGTDKSTISTVIKT